MIDDRSPARTRRWRSGSFDTKGRVQMAAVIRVFLLDDHEIVRRGLRDLLEADDDIKVVGEAGTAEEAYGRIPATQPDVAVLDVQLPDGNGVEVCRQIRSDNPEIRCLILTSFADDEALLDAIMGGASGYLLKQIKGVDFVSAVRSVAAGESLLDPKLTAKLFERLRDRSAQDERLKQLTDQERRILTFIADGYTNRRIAEEMFLAEKTVKNYVSNLLSKMGMSGRTEAAVYAVRNLPKGSSGY
jgi:two-component system, NarL family, response regulator DevR